MYLEPYINGAAHERVALIGLQHDLKEVWRSLAEIKVLSDTTGEVLHGLSGRSTLQSFI
jgi:hypothetical protein